MKERGNPEEDQENKVSKQCHTSCLSRESREAGHPSSMYMPFIFLRSTCHPLIPSVDQPLPHQISVGRISRMYEGRAYITWRSASTTSICDDNEAVIVQDAIKNARLSIVWMPMSSAVMRVLSNNAGFLSVLQHESAVCMGKADQGPAAESLAKRKTGRLGLLAGIGCQGTDWCSTGYRGASHPGV